LTTSSRDLNVQEEIQPMTRSTITVRCKTTVPKKVREKLGVGPSDSLDWEVVGDLVKVSASGGGGDLHGGLAKARKIPPGAGAFDSGYSDTADRTDEVLRESGFGRNRP
jgi:bifunctional DNA-binding transcriptional regulator/antitoxin component of YhaV-PrlF toxin-antitoxin module